MSSRAAISAGCCRWRCGDGLRCTTRLANAHITGEREVFYRHHPWYGRFVLITSVVEKRFALTARCRLSGNVFCLPLELPLWMLERSACSGLRFGARPEVDVIALSALQALLNEVGDGVPVVARNITAAPDLRADFISDDQIRGDLHAPLSQQAGPVRTIRAFGHVQDQGDAGLASPSVSNPRSPGRADGPATDGTRGGTGEDRRPGRRGGQ